MKDEVNEKNSNRNIFVGGGLSIAILVISIFLPKGENLWLRLTGVILLAAAVIFWVIPVVVLKKNGDVPAGESYFATTKLVTHSIYGIVRHPQYLAYIFLVIGFAFIKQNWVISLLAVAAAYFFFRQGSVEDELLKKKYGKSFEEYKSRVPGFNFVAGILNRSGRKISKGGDARF